MTPLSRRLAWVSSLVVASGCGRIGYERLDTPSETNNGVGASDAGGADSAGGAQNSGSAGMGLGPSGAGVPGTAGFGVGAGGAGGNTTAGSGTGPAGAGGAAGSSGGGAGGDAGSSSACSGGVSSARLWSFDSGDENWILELDNGVSGSLAWTGASGHTSAGSLFFSGTFGQGNRFGYVRSSRADLGDLTGRVVTAHVLLESGALSANLYVLDSSYRWADAGWVALGAGGWTCLPFHLDAPAHADAEFDPANVLEVGLQLAGEGGAIYLDDVGY